MKKLFVVCVAACVCLPSAAFALGPHGEAGMHAGSTFAMPSDTPGTNSLGTALPASGTSAAKKGALLGTGNPAIDRENARVEKKVHSICRGC